MMVPHTNETDLMSRVSIKNRLNWIDMKRERKKIKNSFFSISYENTT